MDSIIVSDLLVQVRVGVTDEERAQPQNVLVSFEACLDLAAAGASDDLADTLDYGSLLLGVTKTVNQEPVRLIEHLAERVATFLLELNGVGRVSVEVAKERPPIPQNVGRVSVRVERHP